jgi:hypothetical protein
LKANAATAEPAAYISGIEPYAASLGLIQTRTNSTTAMTLVSDRPVKTTLHAPHFMNRLRMRSASDA